MDIASSLLFHLLGLFILLSLSAFFSGSETALFSLSKAQVERLRHEPGKRGSIVARLLDNPRRPLITILVGNMTVNVASASLVASFVTNLLGNKGAGLAVAITTMLLLIFGEITPKTIAIHNAENISRLVSYPLELIAKFIFPLRFLLRTLTNFLLRLMGGGNTSEEDNLTTEEFKAMVDAAKEEGSIEELEKNMLNTIFDLRSITAAEIMTPRTEMVCISEDSTIQQLFELARSKGRSRIPVYNEDIDHISGIAYLRDLSMWRHYDVQNMIIFEFIKNHQKIWPRGKNTLIRQPFFVPETRTAIGLFQDFHEQGVEMAILLDEYGGTAGLVTIDDLVRELVGDTGKGRDIFSAGQDLFEFVKIFPGRTSIRNVNRSLELELPADEDVDTIGGYVVELFGRIPHRGEKISEGDLEFEVAEADRQKVTQVIVKRFAQTDKDEEDEEDIKS